MIPRNLEEAIGIVQRVIERAQRLIETKADGEFQPVLFLFTEKRGVDIIGLDWDSEEEKNIGAKKIRLLALAAQLFGLWGVMLITDNRMWHIPEDAAAQLGVPPEELIRIWEEEPQRLKALCKPVDALFVNLETYLGDWRVSLAYDRLADKVAWHPPEVLRHCQMEGRFVNLLPPLPVNAAGQA